MANQKVRAGVGSIKFTDLFLKQYDADNMPSIATLEAHGLCVMLSGLIVNVAFYEWLCDEICGVE